MSEVRDELNRFLRSISGVTCFTENLKIYAPTCYGKCVDKVERLRDRVNQVAGGSTVYDAEGSWYNEDEGRVETEPVKVIEVAHNCFSEDEAEKIAGAIADYAREAGQSAMAVHGSSFYIAETPELLEAYDKFKDRKPRTF